MRGRGKKKEVGEWEGETDRKGGRGRRTHKLSKYAKNLETPYLCRPN